MAFVSQSFFVAVCVTVVFPRLLTTNTTSWKKEVTAVILSQWLPSSEHRRSYKAEKSWRIVQLYRRVRYGPLATN